MTDRTEIVARALAALRHDKDAPDFERFFNHMKSTYMRDAGAAIAAMQEPPHSAAEIEVMMLAERVIERERLRCWHICEGWIATFKDTDIKYTSPREYATDAIHDIMDLITDGQDVGQTRPLNS